MIVIKNIKYYKYIIYNMDFESIRLQVINYQEIMHFYFNRYQFLCF